MHVEESKKNFSFLTDSLNKQPFEVADLLVAYLEQLGIEYVFGVPGGAIEPLYNALARSERRGGPRAIVARHETGAAFMAAGYASNSNKIGVCCSTTGPGATNLITGVASAYENKIPLLVITPQTALSNFGKKALQESSCTGIDIVGMFKFCTSYNSLVSHIDQFENKLCSALINASQQHLPVHLSIPLDLQRTPAKVNKPSYDIRNMLCKPALMDIKTVYQLEEKLIKSKKTVFVIGADSRGAIKEILNIAALLNATIVTTPHGKGLINPYHPLYRGIIGFAGHDSALQTILDKEVDAVIAVGTLLSEWASNGWDTNALLNKKLIHVESEEKHFIYSPMANLHVLGNIKKIFSKMFVRIFSSSKVRSLRARNVVNSLSSIELITDENNNPQYQFTMEQIEKCSDDSVPIKPQRLMTELPKIFPTATRYVVDPGNSQTWAIHYLHPDDRRVKGHRDAGAGLFQSSLEYASMGWAIGNSIGVAIAKPDSPVVCITGDGSFLMSGQEITVAIQENLNIIFIILNDSALGMVKHGQKLAQAEPIGFTLPIIDYASVAESMGIDAYIINSPQDLLNLNIDAICKHRGPVLLDIKIDAEETPPMYMRMKILGTVA